MNNSTKESKKRKFQKNKPIQEKADFEPLSTTEITNYFADDLIPDLQCDGRAADKLMLVLASMHKQAETDRANQMTALLYLIAEKVFVHTTYGADAFLEYREQNGLF